MDKTSGFTQLHAGFEELVEMHHEKVRDLVARVHDMYDRQLLNDAQTDAYIRELKRVEINSDRLDQIRNILDRVEKEAINGTSSEVNAAVSHTIQ